VIHLSTRSDYAIKALVRLALADGTAPVSMTAIVTGATP
jgi:DNA-binding IscR family transcriptional regulator